MPLASTGPFSMALPDSGWGFMGKLEQELSADGRVIGILRYGEGFDDSSLYDQQATVHVLLYDPPSPSHIQHDVVGLGFTWAKAGQNRIRSEYNAELFYRLPIFPHVDATVSYQSVFRPAFTKDIDQASVFTLRLRTSFRYALEMSNDGEMMMFFRIARLSQRLATR